MHYNIICISAAIYWHIHVAIANYIIMGIDMSLIGMNTLRSRAVGASLKTGWPDHFSGRSFGKGSW